MKRLISSLLPFALLPAALAFVACPPSGPGTIEPPPEQSATPTINSGDAAVTKTAAAQKSVEFTLTSVNTGTWRVYDVQTGGEELTTVSAAFSAPILTLTATGSDLAAAAYYVSVEEAGKTESGRLELTVADGASFSAKPAADNPSVHKTEAVQQSVEFTLTNEGYDASTDFTVYANEYASQPHGTVTAAFNDVTKILTLSTDESDIPNGSYWVSATEDQKEESARLELTVLPQPVSPPPTADATFVEKQTLTQASVDFTLTSSHASAAVFRVYDNSSGGTALADVTATLSGQTLTLASDTSDLPATIYYVSVQEPDMAESYTRLRLTVGAYTAPGQTPTPLFDGYSKTKTSPDQNSAVFTPSARTYNSPQWKLYEDDPAVTPHTAATVSVTGSTLTITANSGALPAGRYYVTVTETGKTESNPAILTVEPYPPKASITISFGGLPTDPVTITGGTTTVSLAAGLTVSVDDSGDYTAFTWILDGSTLAETGSICTLTSDDLTVGRNRLTVIAHKDNVPYSTELVFTVTN